MADRAVRGIHLGSVPHGYRMLDPAMRKVSVAAHVRFVEDACPGVVVTREGWEDVVPWFADDYNPLAPRAPEGEAADDVADDSILDGISPPPVVRELAADRGGGAAASDSGSTADGSDATEARGAVSSRRRRSTANYGPRPAALALSLLAQIGAALKPGGEAFGSQVRDFDTFMRSDFNGSRRPGSWTGHAVERLS